MKECPECKNLINDDLNECPKCGYPFKDEFSSAMETKDIVTEETNSELEVESHSEDKDIKKENEEIKDDNVEETINLEENDNLNEIFSDEQIVSQNRNIENNIIPINCDTNKKNKVIILSILSIGVIIFILLSVIPKVQKQIRLNKSYKTALSFYDDGNYDKAAKGFAKLGKYKDAEEQYLNCFYSEGIDFCEDLKYESAIKCFEKAGTYKDAEEKLKETHFLLAEEEYENKNYKEASEEYLAAEDFEGAEEKYKESVYLNGKLLAANCDYSGAAEELTKIDYEDSKELAERYRRMETERFFDNKFHYQTQELAILLDKNLKTYNDSISAELSNENEKGALIEVTQYGMPTKIHIMLGDIDSKNGTIGEISYLCDDIGYAGDAVATSVYVTLRLADITLSGDEVKQLGTNLITLGVAEQQKNGIAYEAACDGDMLGINISGTGEYF